MTSGNAKIPFFFIFVSREPSKLAILVFSTFVAFRMPHLGVQSYLNFQSKSPWLDFFHTIILEPTFFE
jgi:hypothetical protein